MAVTSDEAAFVFYDIESLQNVFTLAAFNAKKNTAVIFWLTEDESLTIDEAACEAHTRAQNPAFDGKIKFYDLRHYESNRLLAEIFGLSSSQNVNDPAASDSQYDASLRPVCDTDADYDPTDAHPFLAGYNSFNYDTVMLALYLQDAFDFTDETALAQAKPSTAPKPSALRAHNDMLFTDEEFRKYMPKYLQTLPRGWNSLPNLIRRSMLRTGRHIDIARFNEVQQRVGLKRLLGGLGRQIMESDKLSGNTVIADQEQLHELIAYNLSDVVGLAKLFEHPLYSGGFDLKVGLLYEYPEVVYNKGCIGDPTQVRKDRLAPDSSSAQFAAKVLAPYAQLKDIPVVDLSYPHPKIAEEWSLTTSNVLGDSKKFFFDNIEDEDARAQFMEVYHYYNDIQGRNFNDSEHHTSPETAQTLAEVPKRPNNIPYFYSDGTASRAFATFSTGGIHGAEADWDAHRAQTAEIAAENQRLEETQAQHPDPLDLWESIGGAEAKKFLTSKTRKKDLVSRCERLEAAQTPEETEAILDEYSEVGYRRPKPVPGLFEQKSDESTKLRSKYTYTSAEQAVHEDFTSYYPNLLRGLNAFYNPELGEDRYAKIFFQKEEYGKRMKQTDDPAEKKRLSVLRNGTKLILNAASGAGDAGHENNIKMNNTIITMRLLGQLFSWRIGQAQTLAGGKVISTNTDGLYVAWPDHLDQNRMISQEGHRINNEILEREGSLTGVEIKPEPMIVVSKDSNNRLELDIPDDGAPLWKADILGASGGTLACHEEPQPAKSLAHPAVLDWALVRYLRAVAAGVTSPATGESLSLFEPLDRDAARATLEAVIAKQEPTLAARLFQKMVAASVGSLTFPFTADPISQGQSVPDDLVNITPIGHHNRVFFVREGTPGARSLHQARAAVVSDTVKASRAKRDAPAAIRDQEQANQIMQAEGYALNSLQMHQNPDLVELLPEDRDIAVRKVPGVEPHWNVVIDNRDLIELDDAELMKLLNQLDIEVYIDLLAEKFDQNWRNTKVEGEDSTDG